MPVLIRTEACVPRPRFPPSAFPSPVLAAAVIAFVFWRSPVTFAAPPAIPEAIQSEIRRRVDLRYSTAISVALADTNGVTYFSYGRRDLDAPGAVDEDSLFEIGSISKVFTGTILSDMERRGELSTSDLLQDHLPAGVAAPAFATGPRIHLAHLATHMSGLPRMPDNLVNPGSLDPFGGYTLDRFYGFLGDYRLTRAAGSRYEYSNLAVALLGQILARRAGGDYESLLRERITGVLGMPDTQIHLDPARQVRAVAPFNGAVAYPSWDNPVMAPAGGIRSSTREMMRFLGANLGWVASPLYPAMTNAHRPRISAGATARVGLNWFTLDSGTVTAVGHDGQTGGFNAQAWFVPRKQRAVVILATGWSVVADLAFHLLDPSFGAFTPYPEASSVAESQLRRCVGRYVFPAQPTETFTIGLQHGHLTFAYSGGGGMVYTLYGVVSTQTNVFRTSPAFGGEPTATFGFDGSGRTTSMTWNQYGHATRLERAPVPPRLAFQTGIQGLQLLLFGEGDRHYVVEASRDLAAWSAVSTNTLWDGPIPMPDIGTDPNRFFRVRESP